MSSSVHDAIEAGRIASVKRFLSDGGDIELRGTLQRTPLHMAAEFGRTKIAELLLEHGADPNAEDYRQFTPLHRAAGLGAVDLVAALIEAGANVTARNCFKSMPIHEIAGGGGKAKGKERVRIIELLLKAGSPLEPEDSAGRTPLWFAAATGTLPPPTAIMKARLEVLQALLAHGADPKRKYGKLSVADLARGMHQQKKYRIQWPEALALLEA